MRGCRKQMYYMKNPGGRYFEEVYFVLKHNAPERSLLLTDPDLAGEAERIVQDAVNSLPCLRKTKGTERHSPISRGVAFALGAASSSAVIGTVALILGML